jgi:hypothetical protein
MRVPLWAFGCPAEKKYRHIEEGKNNNFYSHPSNVVQLRAKKDLPGNESIVSRCLAPPPSRALPEGLLLSHPT